MIALDRNESYWLLDDDLTEAAAVHGSRALSVYPDYTVLHEAIATYAGVSPEQVCATPGSDAAIEYIARALVGAGGEALLPVPTFYGYETILDRVSARITALPYTLREGHFVFPLAQTCRALARGAARALFLCTPNNPLGSSLSLREIRELVAVARASATWVVADEAYFEFGTDASFLPYLAEMPNLIVVRTFSKAFGLAGCRVGYLLAAPEVQRRIKEQMAPWPIAHTSVVSVVALLKRHEHVRARRALLVQERERLLKSFQAFPHITAYPSDTNFVLVRVPDGERAQALLHDAEIRVARGEAMSRFADAKKLLENTLRLAVPAPHDTPTLLAVLARVD